MTAGAEPVPDPGCVSMPGCSLQFHCKAVFTCIQRLEAHVNMMVRQSAQNGVTYLSASQPIPQSMKSSH